MDEIINELNNLLNLDVKNIVIPSHTRILFDKIYYYREYLSINDNNIIYCNIWLKLYDLYKSNNEEYYKILKLYTDLMKGYIYYLLGYKIENYLIKYNFNFWLNYIDIFDYVLKMDNIKKIVIINKR